MRNGISDLVFTLTLLAILRLAASASGENNKEIIARDSASARQAKYSTMWEALINFDLAAASDFKANKEEQGFINAMIQIDKGDLNEAEITLAGIYYNSTSSFVRRKCERVMSDLMFFRSGWKDISEFDEEINGRYRYKDDAMFLVDAFCNSPKEEYIFISDQSESQLRFSPTGTPIIEVTINGFKRYFWLDTGANYSVLSSKAAEECMVKILSREKSRALTPSDKTVSIKPALIDSLDIAGIRIKNHPAIVVNEIDLRFKFFGSRNITKIDGIIGWKVVQNLDLTIDYDASRLIIKKPARLDKGFRNLFWLGCPVVRLITADSLVLNFGLDTGAEKTTITENILKKVDVKRLYNTTKTLATLGGWIYNNSFIIPDLVLTLDNSSVHFQNLATAYQFPSFFLRLDGFLGSDTFSHSSIRIDWLNGRFDYMPHPDK
jgi:hypothetical protein